jgi:hypothetical protein
MLGNALTHVYFACFTLSSRSPGRHLQRGIADAACKMVVATRATCPGIRLSYPGTCDQCWQRTCAALHDFPPPPLGCDSRCYARSRDTRRDAFGKAMMVMRCQQSWREDREEHEGQEEARMVRPQHDPHRGGNTAAHRSGRFQRCDARSRVLLQCRVTVAFADLGRTIWGIGTSALVCGRCPHTWRSGGPCATRSSRARSVHSYSARRPVPCLPLPSLLCDSPIVPAFPVRGRSLCNIVSCTPTPAGLLTGRSACAIIREL